MTSFSPVQANTLTSDLVEQRIAQLRAQDPQAPELLQQYEQVRLSLEQVAALELEAQQFVDELTEAPKLEAEIQQRLDNLDLTYDFAEEVARIPETGLQERLLSARTERDELNTQISAMDRVLATREDNAVRIRARLAEIEAQLEVAVPAASVDQAGQPSQAEATAWLAAASHLQLVAESRALAAELDSQPVRLNAMLAQRAEMVLEVERGTALIAALNERIQGVPDLQAASVDLDFADGDPLQGVINRLVEDHEQLTSQGAKLTASLAEAQQLEDMLKANLRSLDERFATAKRIVEYGADSDELGPVLFTYWVQIDELGLADATGTDFGDAGSIVIQRVEHESTLASLVSAGAYVDGLLFEAGLEASQVPPDIRTQIIELVVAYREDLRDVISLESKYLAILSDLKSRRQELDMQIEQYGEYMQRLLLWIPNHPPLWTISWATVDGELEMIADQAREVRMSLTVSSLLAVLVALFLFVWRQRLRDYQASMNQLVSRPRSDSIRYTILALGAAALRALPAPLVLLAVAWSFESVAGAPDLGAMLIIPAGLWFSFSLMRIVGEPEGVAREHFDWQDESMDRMCREVTLLIRWWLPLAVVAGLANALTPGLGEEAIGRLTTAVALLVVAVYFGAGIAREIREIGRVWLQPMLNRVRLTFVLVLALILAATLSGRMFTVSVLFLCVILSAWAGIALLLVHAVLMRWLKAVRRRLRFNELMEQRAGGGIESGATEEGGRLEETTPALVEISNDTRQLLNLVTAVVGIAAALIIWEPLFPALSTLTEIQLWSTTTQVEGESVRTNITLATVLLVFGLALVTLLAAKRLPALLEMVLRSRTTISSGVSYTISTLLNYLIVGGGIIVALAALGLQWGQLQWLVAALGVGIGFGLQEIVANFISGLIILFERPIRIGDVVTVGDKDGTVTKIRIRATTIRDWDGKELLVPNKEFITGRLLNWSLSDSQTRLVIPVGIAYGSDVEKALNMLRDIVISHPNTLDDPEPLIVFENFGDNALELSARCFIDALEHRLRAMTELRTSINKAFAEAGIVIAYPQRDIHLDTSAPLRVSLEGPVGDVS